MVRPDLMLLDINHARSDRLHLLEFCAATLPWKDLPVIMLSSEATVDRWTRPRDDVATATSSNHVHIEELETVMV